MGNCITKKKEFYTERLETEIFYLQKENLRSYDLLLRELKLVKLSLQDLKNQNQIFSRETIPQKMITTV